MSQGVGARAVALRVHQLCEEMERAGPTSEAIRDLLSAMDDLVNELRSCSDSSE